MSSRASSGFSAQALLPPAPPAPPRPLASHGEEGEVRLRLRWGPTYPHSCPSGSAMPCGATAGDHQATQNLLRWTLTKTSAHRTPVIPESAQARLSRCHRHRAAISTAIRPPCKPVSLPACLSPPPPPPHASPPCPSEASGGSHIPGPQPWLCSTGSSHHRRHLLHVARQQNAACTRQPTSDTSWD